MIKTAFYLALIVMSVSATVRASGFIANFVEDVVWPDILQMSSIEGVVKFAAFVFLSGCIILICSLPAAWGMRKLFPTLTKEVS